MRRQCIEFPYLAEPPIPTAFGIVAAAAAIAFGYSGFTNKKALRLNGLLLSPEVATIFYSVMCVILGAIFVLAIFLRIQSRTKPRRIEITDEDVSIPRSQWSSRVAIIPYATISDLAEIKVRGAPILYLTHASGRTIVNPGEFTTTADYAAFCQLLFARLRAGQGT